jgi:hypothetical protein
MNELDISVRLTKVYIILLQILQIPVLCHQFLRNFLLQHLCHIWNKLHLHEITMIFL